MLNSWIITLFRDLKWKLVESLFTLIKRYPLISLSLNSLLPFYPPSHPLTSLLHLLSTDFSPSILGAPTLFYLLSINLAFCHMVASLELFYLLFPRISSLWATETQASPDPSILCPPLRLPLSVVMQRPRQPITARLTLGLPRLPSPIATECFSLMMNAVEGVLMRFTAEASEEGRFSGWLAFTGGPETSG